MDQAALALAAVVPRIVVTDFEAGMRAPGANDVAALRRILETAGVQFIAEDDSGGPGVRLRARGEAN